MLGFYRTSLLDFISPLIYSSNYVPPGIEELVHTWSLSVEEQFYLLFPSVLLILGISKSKKYLLIVLLIAPIMRIFNLEAIQSLNESDVPRWFLFGFHTNADALASGCLLALHRDTLHKLKTYKIFLQSTLSVGMLAVVIVIVASHYFYTLAFFGIGLTIVNVAIVLIADWLITNHQSSIGKFFNSPPLVFIGTMSYSLYLWQQPFCRYSEELIWTHYPLNIILMIGFSLFSYFIIEKKFLIFRQNIEEKLFAERQTVKTVEINL
jgi:peptidoglycan/LPS O-acetylase OafA/YrhL